VDLRLDRRHEWLLARAAISRKPEHIGAEAA